MKNYLYLFIDFLLSDSEALGGTCGVWVESRVLMGTGAQNWDLGMPSFCFSAIFPIYTTINTITPVIYPDTGP